MGGEEGVGPSFGPRVVTTHSDGEIKMYLYTKYGDRNTVELYFGRIVLSNEHDKLIIDDNFGTSALSLGSPTS